VLKSFFSRAVSQTDWASAYGRLLTQGLGEGSEWPHPVPFLELKDRDAYRAHHKEHAAVLRKQRAVEQFLAWPGEPFTVPGYNALIRERVDYAVDFLYAPAGSSQPNWRERVVCPKTQLNNRLRGTLLAIERLLAPRDLASVRVYATEQVTAFFVWLRRVNPLAIGSEFLGAAVPRGGERNGVRNEDVTRLTFTDGAFDLVVTNDVLEHVPAYQEAYRELFRVLAPGGLLVFTVPFDMNRDDHLIRATLNPSGEIEHLLPPEYHGDPVDPQGGVLCYQVFGWRMLEELRAVGFVRTGVLFYWSLLHGLLGPDQCVFFAFKD